MLKTAIALCAGMIISARAFGTLKLNGNLSTVVFDADQLDTLVVDKNWLRNLATRVESLEAKVAALETSAKGMSSTNPAVSCTELRDVFGRASGNYHLQASSGAVLVFCEMTEFESPAAMVYKKIVRAGGCTQDSVCNDGDSSDRGYPFDKKTTAPGVHKLSDADINSLRTGQVANDIVVAPYYGVSPWGHFKLGTSYHRKECNFDMTAGLVSVGDVCGQAARSSTSSAYVASTHPGMSRWYQDSSDFGYIFPSIHIGYSSNTGVWGMQGHSSPPFYCTLYDSRGCGQEAWFYIYVL